MASLPDPKRFRIVLELDVEVEDELALRAADNPFITTGTGELGMMADPPPSWMMVATLLQIQATQSLQDAGIRFHSGSALPRFVDQDNGWYAEVRLPAMPGPDIPPEELKNWSPPS